MEENVRTLRRIYDAFAAGDLAAIQGMLASEFELDVSGHLFDETVRRGANELVAYLDELSETWSEFRFDIEDIIGTGDRLVVMVHTVGEGRGSGVPVDEHVAHVWEFTRGQPHRARLFGDRREALRAAALGE